MQGCQNQVFQCCDPAGLPVVRGRIGFSARQVEIQVKEDQKARLDCGSRGSGFVSPAVTSTLLTWARRVCCFYYHISNLENLENREEGESIIYVRVRR